MNQPISFQINNIARKAIEAADKKSNNADFISSRNISNVMAGLADHSNSFDVHSIQEIVLDALTNQILTNGGLEVWVNDPTWTSVPDGWSMGISSLITGTIEKDTTTKQYGSGCAKLTFSSNSIEDNVFYIKQIVSLPKIMPGKVHTVSYYYYSEGNIIWNNYCNVIVRNSSSVILSNETFYAEDATEETITGFSRFYQNITVGATAHSIELCIGVLTSEVCSGSVWIDYPSISVGVVAFRPNELVAGIITTDHITTIGLDAKVIKTGILTVTDVMTIESATGQLKIQGELLTVTGLDGITPYNLIKIGKYDNSNYGMQIFSKLDQVNPVFLADNVGNLTVSGEIKAQSGSVEGSWGVGSRIIMDGTVALEPTIKVLSGENGETEEVILGYLSEAMGYGLMAGNSYMNTTGIHIMDGSILLGYTSGPLDDIMSYNFGVDNEGNLHTTTAYIEGTLTAGAGSRVGNWEVTLAGTLEGLSQGITIDNYAILNPNIPSVNLGTRMKLDEEIIYETEIQTDGIFVTAPRMYPDPLIFDSDYWSNSYFVKNVIVKIGETVYDAGRDYEFSFQGEIVRKKGSRIPLDATDITIEYDIQDNPIGINLLPKECSTFAYTNAFLLGKGSVWNSNMGNSDGIGNNLATTFSIRLDLLYDIDKNISSGVGLTLEPETTYTIQAMFKASATGDGVKIGCNLVGPGYLTPDNFESEIVYLGTGTWVRAHLTFTTSLIRTYLYNIYMESYASEIIAIDQVMMSTGYYVKPWIIGVGVWPV